MLSIDNAFEAALLTICSAATVAVVGSLVSAVASGAFAAATAGLMSVAG